MKKASWPVIGVVLLLAACMAPPKPQVIRKGPSAEELRRQQQQQQMLQQRQQSQQIRVLLMQAERALAADQLTTPTHDNAVDRFRTVLRLDPDNRQAQTGLQLVVMRYLDLARKALVKNQPGTADYLLARARGVDGIDADNPLLVQLYRDIQQAKKQEAAPALASTANRIVLDPVALSRKSPAVIEQLAGVAQRVRQSDESLIIVARDDAEARWVYQQLRQAAPGYRVRGNIKIGRTAYIELEPPIE